MNKEYRYIKDRNAFAIYIKSEDTLIITTSPDGRHGLIYIVE